MPRITFTFADQSTREVVAPAGDSVMDAALDHGLPGIIAQCGGGCTCCTCHCYVGERWEETFAPPCDDEVELLTYAWEPRPTSRLSCQLTLTRDHDGLVIEVPQQQA